METPRQRLTSLGLLILRVGICIFLINHGYGKLKMLQAGDFEKFGDPFGLVNNRMALMLAVLGEFVCPILVAIGFLTRLATIPTIAVMVGAVYYHYQQGDPWFATGAGGSRENAMMFVIPFVALFFTGAGRFSVDGLLWSPRVEVR